MDKVLLPFSLEKVLGYYNLEIFSTGILTSNNADFQNYIHSNLIQLALYDYRPAIWLSFYSNNFMFTADGLLTNAVASLPAFIVKNKPITAEIAEACILHQYYVYGSFDEYYISNSERYMEFHNQNDYLLIGADKGKSFRAVLYINGYYQIIDIGQKEFTDSLILENNHINIYYLKKTEKVMGFNYSKFAGQLYEYIHSVKNDYTKYTGIEAIIKFIQYIKEGYVQDNDLIERSLNVIKLQKKILYQCLIYLLDENNQLINKYKTAMKDIDTYINSMLENSQSSIDELKYILKCEYDILNELFSNYLSAPAL